MKIKDKIDSKVRDLKVKVPAIYIALRKRETPILAKIFGLLTVGYALSPIDLIPDFVPILGYLDDIIVLPLLVALTVKFIPSEIFEVSIEDLFDYKD